MTKPLREYFVTFLTTYARLLGRSLTGVGLSAFTGWVVLQLGFDVGFFGYVIAGYVALAACVLLIVYPFRALGHLLIRRSLARRRPDVVEAVGMENIYRVHLRESIQLPVAPQHVERQLLAKLTRRGYVKREGAHYLFARRSRQRMVEVGWRVRGNGDGTATVDVWALPGKFAVSDVERGLGLEAFADVVESARASLGLAE